jgi:hypothetical protein
MTLVQVSDYGGVRHEGPIRVVGQLRWKVVVDAEKSRRIRWGSRIRACDHCANHEWIYANLRLLDIPKPSSFALGVVLAHFTCHEIP